MGIYYFIIKDKNFIFCDASHQLKEIIKLGMKLLSFDKCFLDNII